MDELYLDNIDEFVNDHNKIVTYKWLSLTLGVHVNTAKQMLYHYLDHKRKESSEPLHATYLVSGKLVENGLTCHKVSVVREDQLEDVKSKMSMTVSVHVYSVQKAVLKDSGPLYSVDYDAVKDNMKNCSKYSAIQCASAVPMSRAEVQQTQDVMQASTIEPQRVKPTVNGHASLTSKPTTKPPKGIMGMFATKPATKKQEASKEIKPEPKEEAPVDEAPKSKPAGKTNSISNFFGNQAAKRPEKTEKKEEKKEDEVQAASSEEPRPSPVRPEDKQIDVPQEQTKDTKKEIKDTKKEIKDTKKEIKDTKKEIKDTKKEIKDTKKEIRSKTKRIQESDSEEDKMDKKRRRRIKRPVSDSSDEEEEVIPDSPQPQKRREPSPCPENDVKEESLSHANQQQSDGKRRKRRRVLKSRNFVDEDGCMVTEKVYESESYSETEEEAPSSKVASKHPIQAKLPTSKKDDDKKKKEKKSAVNASKATKQASIMGFFQKK